MTSSGCNTGTVFCCWAKSGSKTAQPMIDNRRMHFMILSMWFLPYSTFQFGGLNLGYLHVAQVNLAAVFFVLHSDVEILLGHGIDHFRIQYFILTNIGRHPV